MIRNKNTPQFHKYIDVKQIYGLTRSIRRRSTFKAENENQTHQQQQQQKDF